MVVQEVFPDGLIAQDGRLRPGDQIIEINGLIISSLLVSIPPLFGWGTFGLTAIRVRWVVHQNIFFFFPLCPGHSFST